MSGDQMHRQIKDIIGCPAVVRLRELAQGAELVPVASGEATHRIARFAHGIFAGFSPHCPLPDFAMFSVVVPLCGKTKRLAESLGKRKAPANLPRIFLDETHVGLERLPVSSIFRPLPFRDKANQFFGCVPIARQVKLESSEVGAVLRPRAYQLRFDPAAVIETATPSAPCVSDV